MIPEVSPSALPISASDASGVAANIGVAQPQVQVDEEVVSWLPVRAVEERVALETLDDSALDREFRVAEFDGKLIILEDAERFDIVRRRGLEPTLRYAVVRDRDHARELVLARQLARLELTGLGRAYVLGALYNLRTRPGRRTDLETSAQSEDRSIRTLYGCSQATITRYGRLACQVDEVAQAFGYAVRALLLDPAKKMTVQHVDRLASLASEEQRMLLDRLARGESPRRLFPSGPPASCAPASGTAATPPSIPSPADLLNELRSNFEQLLELLQLAPRGVTPHMVVQALHLMQHAVWTYSLLSDLAFKSRP